MYQEKSYEIQHSEQLKPNNYQNQLLEKLQNTQQKSLDDMKEKVNKEIKEMFAKNVFPSIEKGYQIMFSQIQQTFDDGMKELIDRIQVEEARKKFNDELLYNNVQMMVELSEKLNNNINNACERLKQINSKESVSLEQLINEERYQEAIQHVIKNPQKIALLLKIEPKKILQALQRIDLLNFLNFLSSQSKQNEQILPLIWEIVIDLEFDSHDAEIFAIICQNLEQTQNQEAMRISTYIRKILRLSQFQLTIQFRQIILNPFFIFPIYIFLLLIQHSIESLSLQSFHQNTYQFSIIKLLQYGRIKLERLINYLKKLQILKYIKDQLEKLHFLSLQLYSLLNLNPS